MDRNAGFIWLLPDARWAGARIDCCWNVAAGPGHADRPRNAALTAAARGEAARPWGTRPARDQLGRNADGVSGSGPGGAGATELSVHRPNPSPPAPGFPPLRSRPSPVWGPPEAGPRSGEVLSLRCSRRRSSWPHSSVVPVPWWPAPHAAVKSGIRFCCLSPPAGGAGDPDAAVGVASET
jgi:hypothetical protein